MKYTILLVFLFGCCYAVLGEIKKTIPIYFLQMISFSIVFLLENYKLSIFVGAATTQSDMIHEMHRLSIRLNHAVSDDDLDTSITIFINLYGLLIRMKATIRNSSQVAQIDELIEEANEIQFRIRHSTITIDDFHDFLASFTKVEKSIFDRLLGVVNGGVNAVMDDVNGMVNGVNVAVDALGKGDIIGAATGALGSVLNGKINAIKSIANGIGGLFG